MATNDVDLRGVRWADAGAVALAVGVRTETVWGWVRAGLVLARRLPGERGRVRVALGADGWPLAPASTSARNRVRNTLRAKR